MSPPGGMMPLTKRIQNKAKAEGCVHAEQVKAWEAKTKTEPRAGSGKSREALDATCVKAQPFAP